ncbi:MAG: universal stress protein [Pedosphaera sp.]|nr:universal stress protein [Pedosphaera sp.]
MEGIGVHRPRNVDWKRSAALLYGDWGTSKAYVIGLAFAAPIFLGQKDLIWGYRCLPVILAVCFLTALVAYNYAVVCRCFPDGGGVYSAARSQSRFLAMLGALLLVANFTVTAALSGWSAMSYFGVPTEHLAVATMGLMLVVGFLNFFGPKHTGSLAVWLALPMVVVVVLLIGMSAPYLGNGLSQLESLGTPLAGGRVVGMGDLWIAFCGAILALSGVEAIANLTGVMKLDPGSTPDKPVVTRTAMKSILPVGIEVVVGTSLLGLALLALPKDLVPVTEIQARYEDVLRLMAEKYALLTFNSPEIARWVSLVVGIIVGLLLVSAVNTAIAALIGLIYMLSRDGEMPRAFTRLNVHGVPWWPMVLAVALPVVVLTLTLGQPEQGLILLAGLYAIGVVGAITVNLGSCTFNKLLPLHWFERGLMALTFIVLFAVELTIAKTKPDALYFTLIVVAAGFALRAWSQRRAGLRTITVTDQVARVVSPESVPDFQLRLNPGQSILVAARGLTPVLSFALEEARLRQGSLYVLYVKEVAVSMLGPLQNITQPRWQDDPQAAHIMYNLMEQGKQHEVPVVPVYAVSENPAATILDLSATLGIDVLVLGSPHRNRLVNLLKGNVVNEVAKSLPENIRLLIYG